MKLLKLQKMSDWNELSSIAGKWKFCRIYWQWILIEQTFLYTVVYRTSLYNPTNLKLPKKAPCLACEAVTWFDQTEIESDDTVKQIQNPLREIRLKYCSKKLL